jgi:GNAT superfamily N-acetyltransferase
MNIFRTLFGRGPAKHGRASAPSSSGPITADETTRRSGGRGSETPPPAERMSDTSPAGMVAAIGEALEACLLLLASAPGGEARVEDGITVAITRLPISDFNGMFRARLDPRLPEAEIDRRIGAAVAYVRSRGVPFSWWVMPDDQPPDVPARLVAHGFAPEGERPGMALDLARLGAEPPAPEGLAIEEVTDVEGLGEHTRLVAIGFGLPVELETAFRTLLQGLPFGPGSSLRYFLARERGEPVGTSLACLSERAAGIFNVITAPEARDKGVGAAVTHAALRAAREGGHRIAVLESSTMGYNVYRRLGFEEYGKIGHYAWSGEVDGK